MVELIMWFLVGVFAQTEAEDRLLWKLESDNPKERQDALEILHGWGTAKSVHPLIKLLQREQDPENLRLIFETLNRITKQTLPPEKRAWEEWWAREGCLKYIVYTIPQEELLSLKNADRNFEDKMQNLRGEFNELTYKLRNTETIIIILSIVTGVLLFIFLLAMLYFIGYVSSKLKEWREVMRLSEIYIKRGDEINKRIDNIITEIDERRRQIVKFLDDIQEEREVEISKYIDEVEKKAGHNIREAVQALRNNAQMEIQHTFEQLKSQIDLELRKTVIEQREKANKEITAHRVQSIVDLAKILRDAQLYDKCIEYLLKAIEISQDSYWVYYEIAVAYALKGDKDNALNYLTMAIKNDQEIKDRASRDTAFERFHSHPEFQQLMKSI